MFRGEAVVDADYRNTGPVAEFSADVVVAFQSSQHEAAAVDIEHHGQVFCLFRRVVAAQDGPHGEILNSHVFRLRFPEMGTVAVIEIALLGHGE